MDFTRISLGHGVDALLSARTVGQCRPPLSIELGIWRECSCKIWALGEPGYAFASLLRGNCDGHQ